MRVRRWAAVAVAGVMLAVVAVLSLRVGATGTTWSAVVHAYLDNTGSTEDIVVRTLRGPRVVVAVLVGSALAVAGCLIQGLTRNPLADPGILGINAGASLFVVAGIAWFGATGPSEFVWFAFPGALTTALLALGTSALGGRPTPLKLTLVGVTVAALCSALTQGIVGLDPAIAGQYRFWLVGGVGGRDLAVIAATAPAMIAGLVLGLAVGRGLNALSLGEDTARSLGQRVWLTFGSAGLAIVLLAGGAVAAAGPIGFVGLAVPHAVRFAVGPDYRWVLPVSALAGSAFVLSVDVVARVVDRPAEIETGLVIAAIGAPLFLYLVSRRRPAAL